MHITRLQLKLIAVGLIPLFFILSFILPDSATTTIVLALVMVTAIGISLTGMRMEKREAGEEKDLLANPPKKP